MFLIDKVSFKCVDSAADSYAQTANTKKGMIEGLHNTFVRYLLCTTVLRLDDVTTPFRRVKSDKLYPGGI